MDEAFERWWKEMKPAEVDEFKEIFRECWDRAFGMGKNIVQSKLDSCQAELKACNELRGFKHG